MKCQNCYFNNREGVKYCEKCGVEIALTCSNCGADIPIGVKFCGMCGHECAYASKPVSRRLSAEKKLEKMQRFLPRGLTEKVLAQKEKIEGEHKQVTVMFCDMEGFTALSEKLGDEKIYTIIDDIFEILIHNVHSYGGTVNKMTGDGIMALFGAPIAIEEAPQRAIHSSLVIHQDIAKFSERIGKQSGIPPVRMRIGIHTGSVVVGTLGNDLRVEFTAVGDTVNLASRMEGLAHPGTTYVTEATFKLTKGLFQFEELGKKKVKGKEVTVKVYRVIAPTPRRTRFDVGAEGGLTPFVGRERELELLLDGFERIKGGKGEAFSIIGEAGLGKSRLLYEFKEKITSEDVTFLTGQCLPYGRNLAFNPIIDMLKVEFEVTENDDDYHTRRKVRRSLKNSQAEMSSTLPYILELLSVKDSGIDEIPISREVKKVRMKQAVNHIIVKRSEIRPLIIAIEDLHWIDRTSEEVLKNLLDNVLGARILLLFTYRPEFIHSWGSRSYHNQLNLNRLLNRESLSMVRHLLLTSEVETNLEELILEKTEGIPFFIEEFIKSLKDLSIIEKKNDVYNVKKDAAEISIPATIQDVIMARVDSLPETAKSLLQIGSVIGREFSHELITLVMGVSEQKSLSNISISKNSELIYEKGVYPHSTYIFKHALTRDVIYDSILDTKRRKLHVEIGRGIEKVHGGDLDDHYAELFEHLSWSNDMADLKRAVDYGERAARRALAVYAYGEAVTLTEQVLKLQELIDPNDKVKKCELLLQLGDTRLLAGEPRHILDFEAPVALSLAEATNNDTLASRACLLATWALGYHSGALALGSSEAIHWAERADRYAKPNTIERAWADMNLGTVRCTTGDLISGVQLLGNAIDLARKLGDLETFWRAAYNWLFYVSAPQHVDDRLKLAIELTKCSRVGVSVVPLAGALPMMSDAFMVQGQRDHAEKYMNEIRDLAQQSGQLYFRLVGMALDAVKATWDGQLEDAVEMSKRTKAYGDELGLPEFAYVLSIVCGLRAYLHLGKNDEAFQLVEKQQFFTLPAMCLCLAHIGQNTKVIEMLEQLVLTRQDLSFDIDQTPAWVDVVLLEAAVLVGHQEAASLLAARFANSNYLTTGILYSTCVRRHLGTAAALLDRPNDALSSLNSALLDAHKVGFRPEIALIRLELAKLLFERYPEQRADAKEHLQFAVTEFQTMKMQVALDCASQYID